MGKQDRDRNREPERENLERCVLRFMENGERASERLGEIAGGRHCGRVRSTSILKEM